MWNGCADPRFPFRRCGGHPLRFPGADTVVGIRIPLFLLLFSLTLSSPLLAQELVRPRFWGLPRIQRFQPEQYQAHPQNWALAQDRSGRLWAGNNSGLLSFDGQTWSFLETPNSSRVRSLVTGPTGRVYWGAVDELGWVEPGPEGTFTCHSLKEHLPPTFFPLGEVWDVLSEGPFVLFCTDRGLIRFEEAGNRIEVLPWPQGSLYYKAFPFPEGAAVLLINQGLFRYRAQPHKLSLLPGGQAFASHRISFLLPLSEHHWLTGLRDGGLEAYHLQTPNRRPLPPSWNPLLSRWSRAPLYTGMVWDANHLLLGSLDRGLVLTDQSGTIRLLLDRQSGLAGNSIHQLLSDREGNLWVAQDNGLSLVAWSSRVSWMDERLGLEGLPMSMLWDPGPHGDRLWLGTSTGLFLQESQRPGPLRRLGPEGGQVFALVRCGQTVAAPISSGVLMVGPDLKTQKLSGSLRGTMDLCPLPNPDALLAATDEGLSLIRRRGRSWTASALADAPDRIRYLCPDPAGDGFWGYREYLGLIHFTLNGDRTAVRELRTFGPKEGLESPGHVRPIVFQDHLILTGTARPRLWDGRSWHFWEQLERHFQELHLSIPYDLQPDGTDSLLFLNEEGAGRITTPFEPGKTRVQLFPATRGMLIQLPLGSLTEGTSLWTTATAFMCHQERELNRAPRGASAPRILLSAITHWGQSESTPLTLHPSEPPVLPHHSNNLSFHTALPLFSQSQVLEVRYLLEGFDRSWSAWGKVWEHAYTNLPEGTYSFRYQARGPNDVLPEGPPWTFVIAPPWHRTWWAFLLYALLGLALIWLVNTLIHLRLRRENRRLEALVAQRTQELREASLSDPLTGLRNRRYLGEVLIPELLSRSDARKGLPAAERRQGSADTVQTATGYVLLDLDHFKQINDRYGHPAGDRILCQVSRILQNSVRSGDAVVRLGGEEFLILLRHTDPEHLPALAAKILHTVANHPFSPQEGTVITLTLSLGFALFPAFPLAPDWLPLSALEEWVDQSLYLAKKEGRNRGIGLSFNREAQPGGDLPSFLAIAAGQVADRLRLERVFPELPPPSRPVVPSGHADPGD